MNSAGPYSTSSTQTTEDIPTHPDAHKNTPALQGLLAASLVLLLSLTLTLWSWHHARQNEIATAQHIFQIRANGVRTALERRMETYTQMMHGGAGLFDASVSVERDEWRSFVQRLDLHKNYPGLKALGYYQLVREEDRKLHEKSIREEGFPAYAIHPAGQRPEYAPLVFTEPFSGPNLKAFGYDAYAEPKRRTALEIARDTGKATASAKITLMQVENNLPQTGFIMALPVYRNGQPTANIEQRRAALTGYIAAAFSLSGLMEDILGENRSAMNIHIFDDPENPFNSPLYESGQAHPQAQTYSYKSNFNVRTNTTIGGRTWALHFSSMPAFDVTMDQRQPRTLLFLGMMISLLLAMLTWALLTARAMAATRANALDKMQQAMLALKESETLLDNIIENIPISVFIKNPKDEFRIVRWNKASESIFKLPRERVLGRNVYDNWPREQADFYQAGDEQAMQGGKTVDIPVEVSTAGNARIYLHTRKLPLFDAEGNPSHLLVICDDITDRKRTEDELHLAAQVFENSGEGIMITDCNNRIISVNPAFTTITGYSSQEVIGANPKILSSGQQSMEFYQLMWTTLSKNGQWSGEIWDRRKDGGIYPKWLTINTIKNDRGEVLNYIGSFYDITERKAAELHIRFLAEHDALTQLPNRMLFQDRLKQAAAHAGRRQERLALMFIDLDHFKDINDSLGHNIGDLLLQAVAERLTRNVREGDTVSRQGGDEFIILLPDIENTDDARLVAEKLLAAVRQPYQLDNQEVNISFSMGISLYPDDSHDLKELRRQADAAMYLAKQEGRNAYRFFSQG